MKSKFNLLPLILLAISCTSSTPKTIMERIQVRVFNFVDGVTGMFISKKISIEQNKEKIFIYEFDNHFDTIRFMDSKFYFNSKILNIIDQKNVSDKDESTKVYKCLYNDSRDFRSDKYLYLNRKAGLLFLENLFTGVMYEFDTKKNSSIHKKIAFKKFSFKDGPFELQYAKRDYIEINPNSLSIKK